MTLKYTNCRTKLLVIFLLFFFPLFTNVSTLDISKDNISEQTVSPLIPSISDIENIANPEFDQPLLKLQSFQTPTILFLVDDDSSPDLSLDVPFYDFMSNNLSFNVIYYTANDSYNYTEFDAILISRSVAEEGTVETLTDATIPILTMEAGHFDEFYLGNGYGIATNYNDWNLLNTTHYILDEVAAGVKEVYDTRATTNYLEGYGALFPLGCDIQQLAHHNSPSAPKYASLVALEKDGLRYDLNKSTERRAFWGASSTDNFLPETWSLWNKTIHWTLYNDYFGNATITVNVQDLDNKDISNADVELIDGNNISISWLEKTSQSGIATFTNISWGEYDIKVTYRSLENNSLSSLQIVPTRTYARTFSFDYSVIMNEYVDITAPEIDNFYFDNATSTFFAHVIDDSSLQYVYLNLTSHNLSTGLVEIPLSNFTMVWGAGNNYFNSTSLQSLTGTLVNITYNIIAEDIAGNHYATNVKTFDLDDPIAPNIWSYESQDYGNGTIAFTANITDKNGIQAPVILEINDTYYDMYQGEPNIWVFRGMFEYNVFLNYTIYSASDTIGNENGSLVNPGLFPYKNITTTDTTPPRISALSDTFAIHEEGYVEFTVHIDDWSTYQSGVNSSHILIILLVNGVNTPYNMTAIGEITFVFDHIFAFNDNVTYWINAYDNVNNSMFSTHRGPYRIDDNTIPTVSFSAIEYGNGTIDFFAQVLDWPSNDTSAQIFFTNDYFAVDWTNETMIKLNSTTFKFISLNFPYQTQAIWYYANALDSAGNLFDTQIDSALSLQLTDLIAPVINLAYLNSSTTDGEITIIAQATDPYGSIFILNNSIYLNISSILGNASTLMTFDEGTTYIFTTSYIDQTELNITAYVSDSNGNTGFSYLSLLVADKAPPTILQYGIESFTNGTLTIYSEVVEGINGSGLLDDNSTIILNYVYKTQFTEIMTWNGTGNFYSYPIPSLNPNDAVFYRFHVTDKANNTYVTEWEQYFIADTVAPEIIDFNTTEAQKDHISTEILFWTNSRDQFGEIRDVILNYSILLSEGWLNYSVRMSQDGLDNYEKQIIVLSNSTIRYQIIVIDAFNNTAETNYTLIILKGFNPSQFGIDSYSFDTNYPGECKVWIMVIDNFDEHLHNVTITVIDLNTSTIILDNIKMDSEGLNYSISIKADYLHQFSYSFVLIDLGALNGFYDPKIRNSTVLHMHDFWSPTIHDAGVKKINDGTYLFWANVTDWGSGEDPHTLDVILNYDLETVSGGGSKISNTFKQKKLIFNETLFLASITFNDSGTLVWSINASDSFISSDLYSGINVAVVLPSFSGGFDIEWIIAAVIVTSIAFLFVMSSVVSLRRRRTKKVDRKKSFAEKLNFSSDVYTIMVSSSAGVPIWSITNVLYKSDETMNGNLSGLSVGIDSFLESFQSDFLTKVHGSESSSSSQIDGNIKLSVIEQNKVQILIIGSFSYRIFVFLKEIPTTFIRETFLKIIKEMEQKIPLVDLGIVDEDLQGPLVKAIIHKSLPVGLLEPFKIDLDKLSDFDERMKSEKAISGMTRNGVNVLKILSISHLVQSSSKKQNKQSLLKLFNQTYLSNSQLYSGTLLFKDAMNLLNKVVDFTPEDLYEAFWIGIDEKVKILIPASSINAK